MAKLSNANQQEVYPLVSSFFGSVGVLFCLIVTVMGIKLWWFKYRMNIEQTSMQNGAAGGQNPNVVVARREKKTKFSKDKRWSQQVYQSVAVHGVFKQKNEDDVEIHRPQHLPPVRIRHAESAPSLILPPPRIKRRQEQTLSRNSEGIYETIKPLDATTPEHSSRPTSLVFNEPDSRISLTFEEFENQFQLQKQEEEEGEKRKIPAMTKEKPQPPKRTNRSNSTLANTEIKEEKPHRFLKSSQSIAAHEYHKVMERRSTGFQRPTQDDLTKINDIEEPRFEKFGDRRPTGYIKYEEVDFHISEIHRDYKQPSMVNEPDIMNDSGYMDNLGNDIAPLEAIRNEQIIYQNNAQESLYINTISYANHREILKEFTKEMVSPTANNTTATIQNIQENPLKTGFINSHITKDLYVTTEQFCDDSSSLDHIDIKAKEVPCISPSYMEPQAFVFCDEEEQHIYSEPQRDSVSISHISNIPDNDNKDILLDISRPTNAGIYENTGEDHKERDLITIEDFKNLPLKQEIKSADRAYANLISDYCELSENPKTKFEITETNPFKITDELEDNKLPANHIQTVEFLRIPAVEESTLLTSDKDLTFFQPTTLISKEIPNVEYDNVLAVKQNMKFEFNQVENKLVTDHQTPMEYRAQKDLIKEDLYEEIQVQDIKFEDLYEEIPIAPIKTKTENSAITKTEIFHESFENATDIDTPIAVVRNTTLSANSDKDYTSSLWLELEKDVQLNLHHNIDEEFDKIRHSFEMNEADFLEIKDELQLNSPLRETIPSISSLDSTNSAFGKSIEEDWDNFEKLKLQTVNENRYEIIQGHKEIQITFDAETKTGKTKQVSILKETKMETNELMDDTSNKSEEKIRKTKVTFDFNTEEHVIPARRSVSDEESAEEEEEDVVAADYNHQYEWEDPEDYDDDVYNKLPPPIPTERKTINKTPAIKEYKPILTNPSTISLFGSQISQDETDGFEDSWSAIRKHRHLTSQFQNLSLDSPTSPPPTLPSLPPPPLPLNRNINTNCIPKPAIRNPMAQLAIQRAKEIRDDSGGFKTRSIKDSKQAQEKKLSQEILHLKNNMDDTEA